ncbi:MAG: hypothetical protein HC833_15505 [Leptolyngbyaceae cyanobacterium RM1_406_9]|nr:hypothetical protein [Leptolyngbyaceae cyanobacterium RM1_406_9]
MGVSPARTGKMPIPQNVLNQYGYRYRYSSSSSNVAFWGDRLCTDV